MEGFQQVQGPWGGSESDRFHKQQDQYGWSTVNTQQKQWLDYIEPDRPHFEFKF